LIQSKQNFDLGKRVFNKIVYFIVEIIDQSKIRIF